MVTDEILFLVEENESIEALELQDYNILLQMLRPEYIDNAFAISCVVDIFYYLYFKDVPSINSKAANIFVARKKYLDWVMQTKEFESLKVITVNKKDKSLLVSVHIVNAVIDAYFKVIKQYSNEDIQLITRYLGHKATIFSAPFLHDTNYPSKLVRLETEVCEKVVQTLMEDPDTIIKEIQNFMDELLNIEKELFDRFDVPFTINYQK